MKKIVNLVMIMALLIAPSLLYIDYIPLVDATTSVNCWLTKNTTVYNGEDFWITGYLNPSESIGSMKISVEFSNNVMGIKSSTAGSVPNGYGFIPGTINNATGTVNYTQYLAMPPYGSNTSWFVYKCHAEATGTCYMNWTYTRVLNASMGDCTETQHDIMFSISEPPSPPVYPPAPTNVAVANYSDAINLTWTKDPDATKTLIRYVLYTDPVTWNPSSTGSTLYNDTGTYKNHTPISSGITVYYALWSYNASGINASDYVTIDGTTTTPGGPSYPDPPEFTIVAAYNSTRINLSWNNGNGATRTVICAGTSAPSNPQTGVIYNETVGTGTSYQHGSGAEGELYPGTLYYYRAWSFNSTGFSETYDSDAELTESDGGGSEEGPPDISSPDPGNGETNVQPAPLCDAVVTDDDLVDIYWYEIQSGSYLLRYSREDVYCVSGTTAGGFIYSNATEPYTTYYWCMNVTDGGNWTNATFSFILGGINFLLFDPEPVNASTNQTPYTMLSCKAYQECGGNITVRFYTGTGELIGIDSINAQGFDVNELSIFNDYAVNQDTSYTWYCNGTLTTPGGYVESQRLPETGYYTYTTMDYSQPTILFITVYNNGTTIDDVTISCPALDKTGVTGSGGTSGWYLMQFSWNDYYGVPYKKEFDFWFNKTGLNTKHEYFMLPDPGTFEKYVIPMSQNLSNQIGNTSSLWNFDFLQGGDIGSMIEGFKNKLIDVPPWLGLIIMLAAIVLVAMGSLGKMHSPMAMGIGITAILVLGVLIGWVPWWVLMVVIFAGGLGGYAFFNNKIPGLGG